jgi:nucleoid DNA-binding protein
LSRPEIIKQLKEKYPKLKHSELGFVLDSFCEDIKTALKKGQRIEIRGLGIFFIKEIKEKYSGRNPKTGELIYIPKKNKIRFKPAKNLKEYINE